MTERDFDVAIGLDIKEAVFPLKSYERIRVIKPNQVITEAYDEERLNVVIDANDIVTKIFWG